MAEPLHTRRSLAEDLRRLGLGPGDLVMVHAAVRRVGRLLGGPDALIAALCDAVGPDGTVAAYADWDAGYEDLVDATGRVPERWRGDVPGFDARTSRASRDNGVLAEFLRTVPGARRSGNPGASVAAIGARAAWLTEDHPIDYGYGPGSPFEKLAAAQGKVLMLGAPLDTMTLLHHAEHLARLPDKRRRRIEVPFADGPGVTWRWVEEFETARPVTPQAADDTFAVIVEDFLAEVGGSRGLAGEAPAVLVEAAPMVAFAVRWMEGRFGGG